MTPTYGTTLDVRFGGLAQSSLWLKRDPSAASVTARQWQDVTLRVL